jgi:hypothetical protein
LIAAPCERRGRSLRTTRRSIREGRRKRTRQVDRPRWIPAVKMPAVWKVYAALAIAVAAFLAFVLLMALGLVATPST